MAKMKFADFVELMKSNNGYGVKRMRGGAITHYELNYLNDDKGLLVLHYEVPDVSIKRHEVEFYYYDAFSHLVRQQEQGRKDIVVDGLLNLTYLARKIATSITEELA